jgi:hypothetical protein
MPLSYGLLSDVPLSTTYFLLCLLSLPSTAFLRLFAAHFNSLSHPTPTPTHYHTRLPLQLSLSPDSHFNSLSHPTPTSTLSLTRLPLQDSSRTVTVSGGSAGTVECEATLTHAHTVTVSIPSLPLTTYSHHTYSCSHSQSGLLHFSWTAITHSHPPQDSDFVVASGGSAGIVEYEVTGVAAAARSVNITQPPKVGSTAEPFVTPLHTCWFL